MIKKEIGSDFTDILIQDEDNLVFPIDTKWFISGRSALDYIIKDIKSKKDIKSIAVPSYCCDTMLKPLLKNDLEIIFYSITYKDNQLVRNINVDADVLLYIDYFGYTDKFQIDFPNIIINDISHSIFNHNKKADYYFGSLRKWAGFITGGFAYSDNFSIDYNYLENKEYISLKQEAILEKSKYLNNEIDSKDYLKLFSKAEEMLEDAYEYAGYEVDIYKARRFNFPIIKNKRINNARKLLEVVKEYALFKEIDDNDCPLFVPIIVPENKRDGLRKHLINHNVYCPIHWPITSLHKLNDDELFIYENELSLICDQRYDIEDMEYINSLIKEYLC